MMSDLPLIDFDSLHLFMKGRAKGKVELTDLPNGSRENRIGLVSTSKLLPPPPPWPHHQWYCVATPID